MTVSLPLFHRIAGQPVIVLGSGDGAQAKRRLVERAGGRVVDDLAAGVAAGARLAFIAHDSHLDPGADAAPDASAADAATLRGLGLLVNVVDQPDLCDFTTPAIIDRTPVLVAIGTGGASAGLAKALRLRLEALLPAQLGALARGLGAARGALRTRFPDAGHRRRALDAALGEGGPLDPLEAGRAGTADAQIAAWLENPDGDAEAEATDSSVVIHLVSDDPEDLTLRDARLLGGADQIAHEPDISPQVLARARADAGRIAIGRDQPAPVVKGRLIVLRAPRRDATAGTLPH